MVTLTREEAQQVLDALCELEHDTFHPAKVFKHKPSINLLRARLAQPEQTSVAEQYAHRLAILLECMILSPDKTWDEANNLVSEYQNALHKEQMNAGEPYVSGFGKD